MPVRSSQVVFKERKSLIVLLQNIGRNCVILQTKKKKKNQSDKKKADSPRPHQNIPVAMRSGGSLHQFRTQNTLPHLG